MAWFTIVRGAISLGSSIIKDYDPSKSSANAIKREWRKRIPATRFQLREGSMIWCRKYVATEMPAGSVYDTTPFILCIRSNKDKFFGINVNWLTRAQKNKLALLCQRFRFDTMDRRQRKRFFNKLKVMKLPRDAFRLYFKEEILRFRPIKMENEDFFLAIANNLIHKRIVTK